MRVSFRSLGGTIEQRALRSFGSSVLAALLAIPIALVAIVVAANPAAADTAPAAPTAVTVTAGNLAALVAYTPGADSGSPVQHFDATCSNGSDPTQTGTALTAIPIVVSPLVNGDSYTCTVTATNAAGTSVASVASNAFAPAPVPDAPTTVTATRADSQVSVGFTPGAQNGSPITNFTATCSPVSAGTPGTSSNTASPVVVTGLTNGDAYTCTVVATNASGPSFPSAPSSAATPAPAPGAPTAVTVTAGNTSALVGFTPGSPGGDPITNFTATCSPVTTGTLGTVSNAASPITVTGLTNGDAYTCTVTATSVDGTGPASSASGPFVPAAVPDAPTALTATSAPASVQVGFTPGANNGSQITGYTATCSPVSAGTPGTGSNTAAPVTVAGLTNGDAYTCTVVATNANGPSFPSAPSGAATPAAAPAAPANVTATPGNGSATVAFTPGANNGSLITNFSATCAPVTTGTPGTGSNAASPVVVSGLTNGDAYTCTVTATNAAGTSGASQASSAFTPANVPAAPTNVTATAGHASASIAFTPGANNGSPIITFNASCTTVSGPTGSGSATASPIHVTGLVDGDVYTCTVTATNAAGISTPGTSNAIIPAQTVPDPPTAVTATQPGPPPVVATTWSVAFIPPANDGGAPGGITSYTVSCTSSDGGPASAPTTGSSSPIVVTGLTAGNTYACTVTATSAKGTSAPSVPSSPFASQTAPQAPTDVAATAQNGGAAVTFTPGASGGSPITDFFAACTSSDGGSSFGIFAGLSSPIVVLNLTNGNTYTCTVKAQNANGLSPASAPSASFVVSAIPGVPGPPTIGTAAIAAQSATVSFTAGNPGASPILSFTVTCTSTNGGVAASATDVTSPIFVFGLTNGRTYSCSAIETNASGPSLPSGHTTAFLVGDLPGPPGTPSAQPGNGSATVSWPPPASNGGAPIIGYVVTPYLGTAAQPARTFNSAATTEAVTGLTNGKTYTFSVVAKNGIGPSPASNPSAGVLIGTPSAPRAIAASPGTGSATLTWAPPTNPGASPVTGYVIVPYANGAAQPSINLRSVARSQIVGHLKNGVIYVFRVIAVNGYGRGPMSTPSQGIKVGLPTAPTAVHAQKGPTDSLIVSWTASNDNGSPITKYTVVCTSTNGGATQTQNTTQTSAKFKKPSRKKIYTCTASATNARGTGPTSAPSNAIQTA